MKGTTGSAFSIGLVNNGRVTRLATVNVPKTGDDNWTNYQTAPVDDDFLEDYGWVEG